MSKQISYDIKQFSYEICQKHKVIIRYIETDKDHIHYMIESEPNINLSNLVRTIKLYTTYHVWKQHDKIFIKTILEGEHFLDRRIFYL